MLDVSDPMTISLIGRADTDPPNGLRVDRDRAYIAAGTRGLDIVDVRRPGALAILGNYATTAGDVVVIGSVAYIAAWENGLQIIDVGNPDDPRMLGSLDTPGQSRGISVAGERAYVADGEHGLQIIDVGDPAAPKLLGAYDTGWRRR